MAPSRRVKYTEEDDRLMWKYYISRLRQKDAACKHPSLQFWTAFKEKYGWQRAVSGIESHFRKYLKENIQHSDLKERYLFTAMKKLQVQMNLMDYDRLERKFNCTLYHTDDMTFKKALRGNTEISKLVPTLEIEDGDYPIVEDDEIFGDLNPRDNDNENEDEDTNNVVPTRPAIIQSVVTQVSTQPTTQSTTRPVITQPITQASIQPRSPRPSTSNQHPTIKSSPITPTAVQRTYPMRPSTRQQFNFMPSTSNNNTSTAKSPTNRASLQDSDSPIARRTRSRASVTPNVTPTISPQKRGFNCVQSIQIAKNGRRSRTFTLTNNQQTISSPPTLKDIKSLLIERLKMVLTGELEAHKLDDHPLLSTRNVKGFENLLKQQKVMLTALMANNNQLRFFDKDFGSPEFKKRRPIPMPRIIKIEPESSPEIESNVSTDDDDRYPYAYLAIP